MPEQRRSGNSMSSKQMARAAVDGRRITFQIPGQDDVSGYLVGMDDYHWLVVTASPTNPQVALVSKGCTPIVIFDTVTLDIEDQSIQDKVAEVGGSFMSWCERTYFAKKNTPKESHA